MPFLPPLVPFSPPPPFLGEVRERSNSTLCRSCLPPLSPLRSFPSPAFYGATSLAQRVDPYTEFKETQELFAFYQSTRFSFTSPDFAFFLFFLVLFALAFLMEWIFLFFLSSQMVPLAGLPVSPYQPPFSPFISSSFHLILVPGIFHPFLPVF